MQPVGRAFLAATLFVSTAGAALAQDADAVPSLSATPVRQHSGKLRPIPFSKPTALPVAQPAGKLRPIPFAKGPASEIVDPALASHQARKVVTKTEIGAHAAAPAVGSSQSFKSAVEPTAPADSVAARPRAASAPVVETRSDVPPTRTTMGVGGWVLFGAGIALLFGAITMLRRRQARTEKPPSLLDL